MNTVIAIVIALVVGGLIWNHLRKPSSSGGSGGGGGSRDEPHDDDLEK